MLNELELVALTRDLPEHGLKAGDIGTIVLVHNIPGYEVEFATVLGETLAVISVEPDDVRLVGPDEISQARPLERHA